METRLDAAAAKVNSKARRLDSTPGNGRRRRRKKDLILRVETKDGAWFIRVLGNEIRRMTSEPNLENAEKLRFEKSETSVRMRPMKPMKPLKPMRRMRPMEMSLSDMQMSMGGGEPHGNQRNISARSEASRLQWESDIAVVNLHPNVY